MQINWNFLSGSQFIFGDFVELSLFVGADKMDLSFVTFSKSSIIDPVEFF